MARGSRRPLTYESCGAGRSPPSRASVSLRSASRGDFADPEAWWVLGGELPGRYPRASRAGSPGSCGHVCDLGGGAGFRERKPRGRQHRTRRARPSGSRGESRLGGLREVTRRAWPWTWLESPGGIQGTQAPAGLPQARVDSASPWGPQRAAARTAFLYSRPACFSLWITLLPLPPPGYDFITHYLINLLFI